MNGPRLWVCTDPLDTMSARWVLNRNDPDAGTIVLHPTGRTSKAGVALAGDLLDSLGVTGTQRRVGRVHENAISHLLPWLLAHPVRDLVVHGHGRVPNDAFELLLELVSAAGTRLWLTGAPLSASRREQLSDRGAHFTGWAQTEPVLRALLKDTSQLSPAASAAPRLPAVPADDFATFRAALRATLTTEQFADADALYLETLRQAHAWLQPVLAGDGTRAQNQPPEGLPVLDRERLEAAVARYLHTLIQRSSHASELTVRIRAAQTAAFHLGWLLQVNLERLVGTATSPSVAAVGDAATWRTLKLYREPYVGAVLVLSALNLDVATMLTLPVHAVDEHGRWVRIHGAELPCPPGAEILLRAQRISGTLEGRRAEEPFLHAQGVELTEAKIVTAVRAAYLDTGIPLLSRLLDHTWNGFDWLNRWGVSLQDVT